MMQITADPSFMTKEQREAVAAFILNYPSEFIDDDEEAVNIPAFTTADEPQADADAEEAAAIFGKAVALNSPEVQAAMPGSVPVPSPPATVSAAVVNNEPVTGNLDKAGLPWDERIHASSRARTADGSWRRKRGIDDGSVAQVESELKALMALPGGGAVPAPPATVAAIPAPPVPAAVVEDRQAYVTLLSVASAAINAKTLTNDQLSAAVVAVGVPSLPLLANRLDLVPQVMAAVKAIIG